MQQMQRVIITALCDLLADQLGQEVKGVIYEERRRSISGTGCHDGREQVFVGATGGNGNRRIAGGYE